LGNLRHGRFGNLRYERGPSGTFQIRRLVVNYGMIVSLFNDVIGPVMRGPSSSHCAAALRIGRLARDLMEGWIDEVLVEFDRQGSLPSTHDTQGSDMGLFGGLLGWEADDARLPGSAAAVREAGIQVDFRVVDAGDPHPNTYRLTLRHEGNQHTLRALSTGGGMIEVIDIDGLQLSFHGDSHLTLIWLEPGADADPARRLAEALAPESLTTHAGSDGLVLEVRTVIPVPDAAAAGLRALPGTRAVTRLAAVLPVLTRRDTRVPFGSAAEMLAFDAGRGEPLWHLAARYEMARGGLDEAAVLAKMGALVALWRRSLAQGLAGTEAEDRVLGAQSLRFHELMRGGRLLDGGALNRMTLYVSAFMEVKSSLGVIVAAPTAGACAALPGGVLGMAEAMDLGDAEVIRAMLAAGLIGVFIATRWTFAAEVGGCQAEGGSASAMTAAALVTLAGGTLAQALAASSMSLQNMLGLICDPVASRVEVPCLGKNVMAAANALTAANMALAGYDPVIPLDEVIEAARQVSGMMPRELRCTSLGGLAATPTARALEARLAAGSAATPRAACGCGASCKPTPTRHADSVGV